jgi:uncharacterized membrane protein
VTLSLTIVTLQLASSQYSPRLLRTFARDGMVHTTLAVLLGTFTYTLTVMRTVRSQSGAAPEFVPQLSVTLAYLLALVSVVTVALFLAHLAQQIRPESMLRDVHAQSRAVMRRVLPDTAPPEAEDAPSADSEATLVCASTSGFLTHVDENALLAAAVRADARIRVDRLPGDSIIAGTPVARVWPDRADPFDRDVLAHLVDDVARAVRTGFERTAAQDVTFGLRQLVDVTVKALSPGINDPTTAVHALSHASALLCEAAQRHLGHRRLLDDNHRTRVELCRPDFAALLDLVVSEPRRYGAGAPTVLGRLLTMLREVAWVARDDGQRTAIAHQLGLVRAACSQHDLAATEPDRLEEMARAVERALAGRWH